MDGTAVSLIFLFSATIFYFILFLALHLLQLPITSAMMDEQSMIGRCFKQDTMLRPGT
jgi:hypothetical protein